MGRAGRIFWSWITGLVVLGTATGVWSAGVGTLDLSFVLFAPIFAIIMVGGMTWPLVLLLALVYYLFEHDFDRNPMVFAASAATITVGVYYSLLRGLGLRPVSGPDHGMNELGLFLIGLGVLPAVASAVAFCWLTHRHQRPDD